MSGLEETQTATVSWRMRQSKGTVEMHAYERTPWHIHVNILGQLRRNLKRGGHFVGVGYILHTYSLISACKSLKMSAGRVLKPLPERSLVRHETRGGERTPAKCFFHSTEVVACDHSW